MQRKIGMRTFNLPPDQPTIFKKPQVMGQGCHWNFADLVKLAKR